ncbi:hypothetical protein [Mycoplasma suis]|uniref:Uncharacterized protein n=1 Tax=Mycoplasma suis (strain Illinois) TaxID=768700 RepID=F0QRM1_MYCSL|nr:hypothetical protein [Mycoplasma suis]ADX98141.1 hypothetical protein MSU_0609 [Mycoplasma suis str. Illinois]
MKKSYEENQKDLEDLKKQNKNLTSVLKNKLDTQSKEEQMKRVGESIHRFNRMLYSWGGFLEKIICHINSEGKGDEKCKNVEDSWLKSKENIEKGKQDKNQSQEGNSDDSQGKIASQKLQEVKGEFLDNQVKIREKLIEGILFWKKSEKLEKQLETMQIILKTDVELLNQLIEKLQKKMKEKAEEAKNTVDELNKSYESLRTTYKELEEVKEQVVNFNHYVGKVKNSMCKNSQYKDSESSCAPNSQ